MKKILAILSCMMIMVSSTCAGAQYTIPFRTYSGCQTHSQTYTSWTYSWSEAYTDSNWNGDSSWSDTGNISSSSDYVVIKARCEAVGTCLSPYLYGSISSPGIPASATLKSMVISFNTNQNGPSITGSTATTYEVYICAGVVETSYDSCTSAGGSRTTTNGDRTAWPTGSYTVETYTFSPGLITTSVVNAGFNFGIQVQNTEASGSFDYTPQAYTNTWTLVLNYTTCP